ncbi:MAG: hypothetical protein L6R39_007347, partial [Caloplaca ligustica]
IDNGTNDFVLTMPGVHTIQTIFARKNEEGKMAKAEEEGKETPTRYEIKVVEGAKHGFAVRCDMENSEEAAQEQIAEEHAVEWFRRWFAISGRERDGEEST